jgi:hypothetical protein
MFIDVDSSNLMSHRKKPYRFLDSKILNSLTGEKRLPMILTGNLMTTMDKPSNFCWYRSDFFRQTPNSYDIFSYHLQSHCKINSWIPNLNHPNDGEIHHSFVGSHELMEFLWCWWWLNPIKSLFDDASILLNPSVWSLHMITIFDDWILWNPI